MGVTPEYTSRFLATDWQRVPQIITAHFSPIEQVATGSSKAALGGTGPKNFVARFVYTDDGLSAPDRWLRPFALACATRLASINTRPRYALYHARN
jgi:hypothetical protein